MRVFGGRLDAGLHVPAARLQGYKKFDCAYGDPNGQGDIAKAKELVKQSGTKGQTVTVWTNNKDPRPAIAQYYADVLSQIGYKTKIKTLDQQVYFDKIGTKSTKAQTGFTDWYQDFPHPADFFQPLLGGESLQSTPTNNQGFVNDPELNKKIDEYARSRDLEKVAATVGRPRRVRRQREGVHRAVRLRKVDVLLLASGWTSRSAPESTRSTRTTGPVLPEEVEHQRVAGA